jgi:hypothetical protein
VIARLKEALRLLKTKGWVGPRLEPFSHEWHEPGETPRLCFARSPTLHRYSVVDVLIAADAYPDGWSALEDVMVDGRLQTWLEDPTRTKSEVLNVFVRAIERSKTGRTTHG